jgi:biotin operon repressor
MSLLDENTQEEITIVGDDGQFKVLAINSEDTTSDIAGRSIELTIKIMVRWRIENVYYFQGISRETVEKEIAELGKGAIRTLAGHTDGIALISTKDDAKSEIERIFKAKLSKAASGWGIQIIDFTLAKANPANKSFIDALESKAREVEEGVAFMTEAQKAVNQMEFYARELKKLKDEGLPIDTAREMVMTMQNKATMQFIKGLEGNQNVMANVSTGATEQSK